jgi:hypothetical protein
MTGLYDNVSYVILGMGAPEEEITFAGSSPATTAKWRCISEAEKSAHIRTVGISEFPNATKIKNLSNERSYLLVF